MKKLNELEEKVENLYLKYLEVDIDDYAKNYILSNKGSTMRDDIDVSAYWTIMKALDGENWKKGESDEAFKYLWNTYNIAINKYQKVINQHFKRKNKKVGGFIK